MPVSLAIAYADEDDDEEQQGRGHRRLEFVDVDWKSYLTSLKPLGLNIMLNRTCKKCLGEQIANNFLETYRETFKVPDDHFSQCCCLLASEIGFAPSIADNFSKVGCILRTRSRSCIHLRT